MGLNLKYSSNMREAHRFYQGLRTAKTREATFTVEKPTTESSILPQDYKHRGGNAYIVPDRGFTKQLHILDPELDVVWDWGRSRWEIWRFPEDGTKPHYVLTVESKDKTYRELGTDVLLKLQKIDGWKYSANQLVEYLAEMNRQRRRRKEKDLKNIIDSIARDTFNYVRGVLQVSVPDKIHVREVVSNG